MGSDAQMMVMGGCYYFFFPLVLLLLVPASPRFLRQLPSALRERGFVPPPSSLT
jgi:hypothetical protein